MSLQDLQKKLARLPADMLAFFLARLADEDPEVRERAESLTARADPEAHAHALKKRLERFRWGRRFIPYAESGALARQLEAWLDEVEEALLPASPEAAGASSRSSRRSSAPAAATSPLLGPRCCSTSTSRAARPLHAVLEKDHRLASLNT